MKRAILMLLVLAGILTSGAAEGQTNNHCYNLAMAGEKADYDLFADCVANPEQFRTVLPRPMTIAAAAAYSRRMMKIEAEAAQRAAETQAEEDRIAAIDAEAKTHLQSRWDGLTPEIQAKCSDSIFLSWAEINTCVDEAQTRDQVRKEQAIAKLRADAKAAIEAKAEAQGLPVSTYLFCRERRNRAACFARQRRAQLILVKHREYMTPTLLNFPTMRCYRAFLPEDIAGFVDCVKRTDPVFRLLLKRSRR